MTQTTQRNVTWLADAPIAGVGEVVACDGVRCTRFVQSTRIRPLAPSAEPACLALAHVPAVDTVAHAVEQAGRVDARAVQIAVVAVEAGLASARVVRLGQVTTVSVVLAGRGGTRIEPGAVPAVESVVAGAVVVRVRGQVPAVASVPARPELAPVHVLAHLAVETVQTVTPRGSIYRRLLADGAVLTLGHAARIAILALTSAEMFRTFANCPSG